MIRLLLNLYILLLLLDAILSFLPQYRHHEIAKKIKMGADFTCGPVRKLLPTDLPFDVSPIVVIVLIRLIMALW